MSEVGMSLTLMSVYMSFPKTSKRMKNGVSQKVRMVLSLYATACLALNFSSLSHHKEKITGEAI